MVVVVKEHETHAHSIVPFAFREIYWDSLLSDAVI